MFGYAAQGGLSANDVLRLLDYLAKVNAQILLAKCGLRVLEEFGILTMIFKLFYAIDFPLVPSH